MNVEKAIDKDNKDKDNKDNNDKITLKKKKKNKLDNVRKSIYQLEKGVKDSDKVLINRIVRKTNLIRKVVTFHSIATFVEEFVEPSKVKRLLEYIKTINDDKVEVNDESEENGDDDGKMIDEKKDEEKKDEEEKKEDEKVKLYYPEIELFLSLLILVRLVDKKKYKDVANFSIVLIKRSKEYNRRTLDLIVAKIFTYYALGHEKTGNFKNIRKNLILLHREACSNHDESGQAVLINAILRNYIQSKLYNQADKFRLNTKFPLKRSPNELARYNYYLGLIELIRLQYKSAIGHFNEALRKSPQTSGLGFRQTVTKVLIVSLLLMGKIPQRSTFRQQGFVDCLYPYFELSKTVRVGDIAGFAKVAEKFKDKFISDDVYNLIHVRLRHNVIKAALYNLNLSYSRISLEDVRQRLLLDSVEETEYVVAKAIFDGAINASINKENGYMYSAENTDVYSTHIPQKQFNRRILECVEIHNTAVKSMRYPSKEELAERKRKEEAKKKAAADKKKADEEAEKKKKKEEKEDKEEKKEEKKQDK